MHGHWTLVRLLRLYPEHERMAEIQKMLEVRFAAEALQKEADYLADNKSFERMYGWAWALRLGLELRALENEQGREWAKRYRPVEEAIVGNAKAYLPKLDWPIRCGHFDWHSSVHGHWTLVRLLRLYPEHEPHQGPMTMHRHVPVNMPIENRVPFLRRLRILRRLPHVRRLVGELPVNPCQGQGHIGPHLLITQPFRLHATRYSHRQPHHQHSSHAFILF